MLLVKTSTEVKNDEDGEKASIEWELEVTGILAGAGSVLCLEWKPD